MTRNGLLQSKATGILGGLAFLAMLVSGSLVYHYGSDFQRRLSVVENGHGNAVSWTASQVEVDLLLLTQAVGDVMKNASQMSDLKRRFRTFYSRLRQTQAGMMKAELGSDQVYIDATRDLLATAEKLKLALTLSDDEVRSMLPALREDLLSARPLAHSVSLAALRVNSDKNTIAQVNARNSLKETKIVQWIVIAIETLTLIALALLLYRLRLEVSRKDEYAAGIEAVLSASPFPAVVINCDGQVLDANAAALEKMCGDGCKANVGSHVFSDAVTSGAPRSEFRHFISDLLSDKNRPGGNSLHETVLVDYTGEPFRAELTAERVTLNHEDAIAIFVKDIEAQLATEEELVRARDVALDANNMKARFLKMVSHESRTPLQGLYSSIDILRNTDNKRAHERALNIAESSVEVLSRHVEDILSFVENNTPSLSKVEEVFLVDTLLDDIKGVFLYSIKSSSCRVRFTNQAKGISIKTDRGRIRQAMICLVNNAFKHTKTGSIEIGAREIERSDDTAIIELWVEDTGKGIDKKDHKRIFEEFVSLSSDSELAGAGMGLGLAICKKIVNALGGGISLDSELGAGSRFTIELPVLLSDEYPAPANIPQAAEVAGGEAILVVDDNAIVRDVISEMLISIGYEVEIAIGGEAGVQQANQKCFDLILMDISMPEVDGITAAKRIAASDGLSAETPIICLTAHAAEKDRKRFLQAGMRDILMKPVKLPALAEAVRTHIGVETANDDEVKASPIDNAVIEEMIKRTPEPKRASRIRQIADYLVNDGKNLEAAVSSGDPILAADMAHKLAGTSQIVGADEVVEICHQLEDLGRSEASEQRLAELLEPLKDALTEACNALRSHRFA